MSGDGETIVKLTPTTVRLRVQFSCSDKTAAAALKKLEDRCTIAVEKIKSLNPLADSIVVGTPWVGGTGYSPYSPANGPYAVPPPSTAIAGTPAQQVSVMATISADWPLAAADRLEAFLQAGERLKKRVGDVNLAGDEGAMSSPEVLYVAKVSPSQREAAVADAFAEAKAHATELASGVGLQRGPLVELSTQNSHWYPSTQYAGVGDSEASARAQTTAVCGSP